MLNLKKKLILGSQSPRRTALLEEAGFSFSVQKVDTDETYPDHFQTHEVPVYLAEKKARGLKQEAQAGKIVLAADTIVTFQDHILEKPKNEQEAREYLEALSNQTHQVITGVCILTEDEEASFYEITQVTFRELKSWEIQYYIKAYQPFDKAGAYAIQEWIGLIGVDAIYGDYFNVVGLPMQATYQKLYPWLDNQ